MSAGGAVVVAPRAVGELASELRRAARDLGDAAGEIRCLLGRAARPSAAPGLVEDVAGWAARVGAELDARVERLARLDRAVAVTAAVGGRRRLLDARGARDVDEVLGALGAAGVLPWCPQPGVPAARRAAFDALPAGIVDHLARRAPEATGRGDGVPFAVRDAANRVLLARALDDLAADGAARTDRAGLARDLAAWRDDAGLALIGFDLAAGRAVLARGDLDAATHVTVLVPGAGQSLARLSERHVAWMDRLQAEVDARLPVGGRAATVLWLDYAPPARAVPDAVDPGAAADGARRLPAFLDGVATVDRRQVTTIGHSYGSVVVGRALASRPGALATDRVVALGSPGLGVQWSRSLALRDDQRLYAAAFPADPVAVAGRGEPAALALLGRAVHGPDPRRLRAATTLELPTDDLPDRGPAARHLQYLHPGSAALDRVAAVAAGGRPRPAAGTGATGADRPAQSGAGVASR